MAEVQELSNGEFNDFVKEGFVVVDFFADGCMPCLMMAPVVEELSEQMKGKVRFGKVNVGDNNELAQKFNVSSIPNFTFFKDGRVVGQVIGAVSKDELEEKINTFLN